MESVFIRLLNMSIAASWLVLALIVFRPVLKRLPAALRCVLWGVASVRLFLPFSPQSILSLIPSAQTVSEEILISPAPAIDSGVTVINATLNPIIAEALAPRVTDSANPAQIAACAARILWICGIALMLLYAVVSYIRLRLRVREGAELSPGVMECDRIATPFILGILRPKIYLPSDLSETDREYVLAHERAHLRRLDHLWKPLGFLLLTLHWFNPLLHIAYVLFCRDVELACDERVIALLGEEAKKPYSRALINCAAPRAFAAACPLAFGEVGVRGRIKSVLNYKKPAVWIVIGAILLCVVAAVFFLTDPVTPERTSYGNHAYDSIHKVKVDTSSSVDAEIISAAVRNGAPHITLKLKNTTLKVLERGTEWTLFYNNNGEWQDCDLFSQHRAWTMPLITLLPGGSEEITYHLDERDMSRKGSYRLEHSYSFQGEDREYLLSVEFELTENSKSVAVKCSGSVEGATWSGGTPLRYFDILPGTGTCYVGDSYGLAFDIRSIRDEWVTLVFTKPVFHNGDEIAQIELAPGESVTVTSPQPGGTDTSAVSYEFFIADTPVYHSEDVPDQLTWQENTDAFEIAGVYSDDTSALLDMALNRDEVVYSSAFPPPFPLFRLDSREETDLFISQFSHLTMETPAFGDSIPPFASFANGLDEDFFSEKSLLIAYVDAYTYSDCLRTAEVKIEGKKCELTVDMEYGELGNGNVPGGMLLIATVEKSALENCEEYSAHQR